MADFCKCSLKDNFTEIEHGKHTKRKCNICGLFIPRKLNDSGKPEKWFFTKTKTENKRDANSLGLGRKYSKGYCELCLTKSNKIPNNSQIEGHHVVPSQYGGSNDRNNIWVLCIKCHRYIENERTYNPNKIDFSALNKIKNDHNI